MELGTGHVKQRNTRQPNFQLTLPATKGYSNAQIDDYNGRKRKDYPWHPPLSLSLDARFSHPISQLKGTAGFGFWNAPFGDPTTAYPTLPKAVWFFFGSPPNDLPLNPAGKGQGGFASTIDATTWTALSLAPCALPTILLNHIPKFRKNVWPQIQQSLQVSYVDLDELDIMDWHNYNIDWYRKNCIFRINDQIMLETETSATGPLGFVCWIDNQYMVVTPTGYISSGTISTDQTQWLHVKNIAISKLI